MNYEDLENNLNLTIEDLYNGLTNIALRVRGGESSEQLAARLEQLAFDICRRWPICVEAHNPPQKPQT